jgi:hypothetical protein
MYYSRVSRRYHRDRRVGATDGARRYRLPARWTLAREFDTKPVADVVDRELVALAPMGGRKVIGKVRALTP